MSSGTSPRGLDAISTALPDATAAVVHGNDALNPSIEWLSSAAGMLGATSGATFMSFSGSRPALMATSCRKAWMLV